MNNKDLTRCANGELTLFLRAVIFGVLLVLFACLLLVVVIVSVAQ